MQLQLNFFCIYFVLDTLNSGKMPTLALTFFVLKCLSCAVERCGSCMRGECMGHMPCTNILLTRITSSMLSRDGPGSAEGEGHAYNIEGSYNGLTIKHQKPELLITEQVLIDSRQVQ